MQKSTQGGLVIFITAGMWGLFWLPLRYIESTGISGLWTVALVFCAGAIFALPPIIYKGQLKNFDGVNIKIGVAMGVAATFYFASLILTDVIRAVFLFYLLPFWAILSARVIYGVRVSAVQMGAALLAMMGLYMLLANDGGVPLPKSVGDWFALASGFFWGVALSMLRANEETSPGLVIAATFVAGTVASLALIVMFPRASGEVELTMWALVVALVLAGMFIVPSMYGQAWGARFLPSATASILTMSEIIFATISYWLLAETSLGITAVAGGILIVLAGIIGLATSH